jgi:flagellar basal-body rod protein FlgF
MPSIESLVSAMQAQWVRHEILSNNLANISTPGFKRDDLALIPDSVAAATAPTTNVLPLPSGAGMIQWTDYSQGSIQVTGRSLDAAINGPGFFVVETGSGPRYTRAGNFNVGPNRILTGPMGAPVMGQRGQITVSTGRVSFGPAGEVLDDGRIVDTLVVVDFPKPYPLTKDGQALYSRTDPTIEPDRAKGYEITGGALESSNMASVPLMVSMIDVLRTYEAAQRALQAMDEANQKATQDIGKVQ